MSAKPGTVTGCSKVESSLVEQISRELDYDFPNCARVEVAGRGPNIVVKEEGRTFFISPEGHLSRYEESKVFTLPVQFDQNAVARLRKKVIVQKIADLNQRLTKLRRQAEKLGNDDPALERTNQAIRDLLVELEWRNGQLQAFSPKLAPHSSKVSACQSKP